jgi:polyhydroxyalkanoate synthesis repressor PhaR
MPRKPVIIKKYENRRLYDTTNSRYINQDEIARLIREGHEVQVLDAASGEDLTRMVLAQIIVEDAKEPNSTFPLDVLRQMVVASGKATQENTLKYMKTVLDMYQNAYRALAPPLSPFEFIQPHSAPPAAPTAPRPVPNPPDSESARTAHAQELQQRVEELEAMMAKMTAKKTATKKSRSEPKSKSRRKP